MLPDMAHESFEREIDGLLDDALHAVNGWLSSWSPACDLYEDDSTYSIAVALPGCHADRIEVQVQDKMVRIKGERKVESPEGRIRYLRHIPEGPFACSVKLPEYVDDQTSTASFQQGVLTITFAKCERAKPRGIMIE
jgi:HSP20 family protein